MARRRGKFGSVPTEMGGRLFASKREAFAYLSLLARQQAGEIRDLECQPKYQLKVGEVLICTYTADFVYVEVASGQKVVTDAKGYRTREYQMKRKLMKALHGIDVVEV